MMIMFSLMLPFVLVPMVGLAIDATMLFSVKAKLQAAVDGGAIAAAQSLNSGLTFAVQQAAAQKAADQFLKANMVVSGAITGYNGYWGANNLQDGYNTATGTATCSATACIAAAQDPTNKRTTITMAATVQVPLLFMRIFGFSSGTVCATGQAARRDVVLVLVIDRSSSMNNTINGTPVLTTLKGAATSFVSQFQSGRDRLGLVVFGGSAIVAYPATDWNNTSPTGPDVNFMTASPNITSQISAIAIGSNTGTAEGLILAYQELKAANQPGALNVIILFTDGQPNGITANFNGANPLGQGASSVKSTSACTYKNNSNGHPSMVGWSAQWGGYVAGPTNNGHGINALAQWSGTSATDWLKSENEPVLASGNGQPAYNCSYASDESTINSDVTIPTVDYYGNSTIGSNVSPYTYTDYQQSEIWSDTGACNNGKRIGGNPLTLTGNAAGDACQVGLASWNAADMAARQIHADTTLVPVIYSMGFEGNGGDDPVFMKRLANLNVAANTVYNSAAPQGMYLQISTPDDIAPAFQTVLAEILRLSM
jgi:Flp pilus assembly protein TadG